MIFRPLLKRLHRSSLLWLWMPMLLLLLWTGSYLLLRWHSEQKLAQKDYSGIILTLSCSIGLSNGEDPPVGAAFYSQLSRNGPFPRLPVFFYRGLLEFEHRLQVVRHHPIRYLSELRFPVALSITAALAMLALALPVCELVYRRRRVRNSPGSTNYAHGFTPKSTLKLLNQETPLSNLSNRNHRAIRNFIGVALLPLLAFRWALHYAVLPDGQLLIVTITMTPIWLWLSVVAAAESSARSFWLRSALLAVFALWPLATPEELAVILWLPPAGVAIQEITLKNRIFIIINTVMLFLIGGLGTLVLYIGILLGRAFSGNRYPGEKSDWIKILILWCIIIGVCLVRALRSRLAKRVSC